MVFFPFSPDGIYHDNPFEKPLGLGGVSCRQTVSFSVDRIPVSRHCNLSLGKLTNIFAKDINWSLVLIHFAGFFVIMSLFPGCRERKLSSFPTGPAQQMLWHISQISVTGGKPPCICPQAKNTFW